MVATWVRDAIDHSPMLCGCLRAYSLTALGARRSELPCRRTGLTALPRHLAYRSRISFSASVLGDCGKSGILYPLPCSSLTAAASCGTEALMLGSLMMLVSGRCVSRPSSPKL